MAALDRRACAGGSIGDGGKHIAVCRLIMSNISSDSLSYKVPEMLSPRVSLVSVTLTDALGSWSVGTGGGIKGLMGVGLGIRGDTIETRSGLLIRLVNDFGDSNRILASRFRRRFGDEPDK
jgi:hypothetical protein